MKKILLLLALSAGLTVAGQAQKKPHAFGVHLGGSTIDLEYQYHFSKRNFLDVTAGLYRLSDGGALQAFYNWNLKEWKHWTPDFASWKVWGGAGAGIGCYSPSGDDSDLFLGPAGTVGFGFTLNSCPLTFGVDYRPMLCLKVTDGLKVDGHGFHNLGLTLTYRF